MTGPVILVVGARPNFMKIAPIHAELAKRHSLNKFSYILDNIMMRICQRYSSMI